MKKIMTMLLSLSLILTMMMGLSFEAHAEEATPIRIGALQGPTAFGLVKLKEDADNGATENAYEFQDFSTDPSTFVAPLAKGEIEIAAVPANLASVIYNNSEGKVRLLAINNLGVLSIVERGETVSSIADLAGKTVYATGQGATPEYTLRYLLKANNIDPDNDVTIQFCADTTEALSFINGDEAAIAMLPQPFVTAALGQVEGLRVALDLNDEWAALDNGCSIVTGVIVANTAFVESNPEAVETFMKEYEASMTYAQENVEDNAALIEKFGIVAKAPVAVKAFPGCHLSLMTGSEMQATMAGYLQILFDENPAAVGGKLPADDFYYGI